jgi:hypothetical protein
MARTIAFEFAGFPETVTATVLEEQEPTYAAKLWADLEQPLKMWPWHTTSTGDWFSCKGRPPLHRQDAGSQAMPIGKVKLMCDIEQGSIVYFGAKAFAFAYGPDVSEPLPARGPVVARATNLDQLYQAGLHVWEAQYRTHKIVIITARRQGS